MDGIQLDERLNHAITSPSPEDGASVQQLAGMEFRVYYDNQQLCVQVEPSHEFEAADAICLTEIPPPPPLEGVAQIGCVALGKGHNIDELEPLALINVYPQNSVYSQVKPNEGNGVVSELGFVDCELKDEQHYAIEFASCDDAAVTLRYLEGDVAPDCVIDALDAQSVAFRWGEEVGDPLYNDFMNVEPSGGDSDTDIDSNDLQFVLGRFGSTCSNPYPTQEPIKP